jgi:ParB family chromosome partitioning protein
MQSDLTDYEKYVGLTRVHSKRPELGQVELGELVGISTSHLNALLSFGRLPEQARAILDTNKAIMGANAAAAFAAIAEAGKAERVVEAVRRLSERELDQAQAVKFAKAVEAPKATKPAAESYKVKTGKSTWCDVRKTKNIMRIEFQSEEVANAVQEAIKQTLEALAAKS